MDTYPANGLKMCCLACNESYYGCGSDIKNQKKCVIYRCSVEFKNKFFVCCYDDGEERKCFQKIVDLLKGCVLCGQELTNKQYQIEYNLAEDPNIYNIEMVCSQNCAAKLTKFVDDLGEKIAPVAHGCIICKIQSVDNIKCINCNYLYYCSKECQQKHEKDCIPTDD